MVCKIDLYHNQGGDSHFQTITAETDGIVAVNAGDSANSAIVSGCNRKAGITLMEHGEPGNQVLATLPDGKWSTHSPHGWRKLPREWILGDQVSAIGIEIVPEEKIEKGGIINHSITLPHKPNANLSDDERFYSLDDGDKRCKDGNVCAWYYHPGNPDGEIDNYPLSTTGNLKGNPCIHADRGIWTQSGDAFYDGSAPKMSCSYSIDEGVLSALHADTAAPNDPRRATWNTITGKICHETNNVVWENPDFKIGNDKTCWDLKKELIKTQCVKTKANRKTGTNPIQKNCQTLRESSPKHFTEIVKEYCQTPEGKNDKYCSCINTLENDGTWCDEDENKDFIGCVEANENFNAMIEAVPEDHKRKFFGTKHCFIDACRSTGDNVYVEHGLVNRKGEVRGCTQNMKICGKYYQMDGTVQGSTITKRCEKKAKDDAEWAVEMKEYQEKGMKQYLENQEKAKKEEEKAKEEAKEEAKIEAVKQEKKEKVEKEEKMLAGGAILMVVMSCVCLVALIYMVKSRRR
jgi:hypothetical protein